MGEGERESGEGWRIELTGYLQRAAMLGEGGRVFTFTKRGQSDGERRRDLLIIMATTDRKFPITTTTLDNNNYNCGTAEL